MCTMQIRGIQTFCTLTLVPTLKLTFGPTQTRLQNSSEVLTCSEPMDMASKAGAAPSGRPITDEDPSLYSQERTAAMPRSCRSFALPILLPACIDNVRDEFLWYTAVLNAFERVLTRRAYEYCTRPQSC